MATQVGTCVEEGTQFFKIAARSQVNFALKLVFLEKLVTHVLHGAVAACDIIAAPALSKWAAMISVEGSQAKDRLSIYSGIERPYDWTGNTLGASGGVADQALTTVAFKFWLWTLFLL